MPTIAFIQAKGGPGKTTAALAISCGLALNQTPVEFVDMDSNNQAGEWLTRHGGEGSRIMLIQTADTPVEAGVFRVIDTEGRSVAHFHGVITALPQQVDLFVVPCNPNSDKELAGAQATIATTLAARPRADIRILWNRVRIGARASEAAQTAQREFLVATAKKLKVRALRSAFPSSYAFDDFGREGWGAFRSEHALIMHQIVHELYGILF
jgi:hypothetical protein